MPDSRPMLVLMPGFDGTGQLFAPLIEQLGARVDTQVIAYPDLTDTRAYVDDVATRLPEDRDLVLVAESFSGPIALHLLAQHPDRVRAAVLSTTFARPPLGLVLSLANKLRLASFVRPAMNEQILRMFCLNGVADIALIRSIVDVVRPIGQSTVASRLQTLVTMDATHVLDAIQQPVLVLSASADRVVRQRFTSSLLARIADVTHATLEGPHLLLQAAPEDAARNILAFLEQKAGLREA
ncbi:MAG: alpha/beta hydrolase [Pseudomonadota bacterium]